MARRYKKEEENILFEIISQSSWKALFFLAFLIWFFVFLIFPIFIESNFILKAFFPIFKFFFGIVIFLFVLAGISKLILGLHNDKKISDLSYLSNDRIKSKQHSSSYEFHSFKVEPDFEPKYIPPELSIELLQSMDWKRFEDLCSAYFTEKRIRNEQTSMGPDGGIDLFLYENNLPNPTAIVQCKRHTGQIGVTLIREFVGLMHHHKIHRGYFFTTSSFNQAAIEFAKSNNLKLIDGEAFLLAIKGLPASSQSKLTTLATQGDYITPTCGKCGAKMKLIVGKKRKFWGCTKFPACRGRLTYK